MDSHYFPYLTVGMSTYKWLYNVKTALQLTRSIFSYQLTLPGSFWWLQCISTSGYNYLQRLFCIEVVLHLHFFLFTQLFIQLVFFLVSKYQFLEWILEWWWVWLDTSGLALIKHQGKTGMVITEFLETLVDLIEVRNRFGSFSSTDYF